MVTFSRGVHMCKVSYFQFPTEFSSIPYYTPDQNPVVSLLANDYRAVSIFHGNYQKDVPEETLLWAVEELFSEELLTLKDFDKRPENVVAAALSLFINPLTDPEQFAKRFNVIRCNIPSFLRRLLGKNPSFEYMAYQPRLHSTAAVIDTNFWPTVARFWNVRKAFFLQLDQLGVPRMTIEALVACSLSDDFGCQFDICLTMVDDEFVAIWS